MLSGLTVKPLLWATGILTLLLAAESALVVHQYKQLGAARAECEVTKLEDTNDRNTVVRDLEAESLRNQVRLLEEQITRGNLLSKAAAQRHSDTSKLLTEYRRQLNEARNADPSLDQPVDTSRLRRLEDAYRVRAAEGGVGSVPRNP